MPSPLNINLDELHGAERTLELVRLQQHVAVRKDAVPAKAQAEPAKAASSSLNDTLKKRFQEDFAGC